MKKNHFLKCLTLGAAFLTVSLTVSAQSLVPDILKPDPINGALLYGLSDNGDWGVSCVSPGYVGFSDFAGCSIYDLRTNPVQSVDLSQGATYCAGFDVTDDGKLVAGSYQQKPAYCKYEDGKWVWHTLPVPDKTFRVTNVFTDEIMEYKLNGGEVLNITPDGKYGVGNVTCNEYINLMLGCMWNLETGEIMQIPGVNNDNLGRLNMISADGRFVVGNSTVYDLEKGTSQRVRVGLDIYAQGMSTNGKYFSGVTTRDEVPYASIWDVEANKVTVLDDPLYADAVAWTITNDGVPFVARPYLTPYADAYVYCDGFLYSFEELLTQVYGIDLLALGIDVTGKPYKVSADGRTVVCITDIGNCYVLRMKEDFKDAVKRVDLYRNWKVSPAEGSRMTMLNEITITFPHDISIAMARPSGVDLLDASGNKVASPVFGGIQTSGTNLRLDFGGLQLNDGEKYTIVVPAGLVQLEGQNKLPNPEITFTYEGRADVPVKPVSFSPQQGESISSISLTDNPVVVTFDNMVKVNIPAGAERPIAKIYIDGVTDLVGFANMDVDQNTGNRLVIFPDNAIPFYKGSEYTIVVPEGTVTDMSGRGASESFTITYNGSLVPQLGDDKYLFRSTCDDYTSFLFYEGDHGYPTYEYREMGFTQDETPWVVVRDDEYSTDMAFGSHSSYSPLVQADDWVATRQITIPEGHKAYLAFDSQSYRKAKEDYLKVIIYENASIINSLNSKIVDDIRVNGKLVYNERQDPGATEANLAGEWTHNIIDLSDYSGKSIYICFLNDNYNGSMVMIDNIEVVDAMEAFITLRNDMNVVRQESIAIRGMVSIESENVNYSTIEMTLKDAAGNVVSTISDSGLALKAGEMYAFEFPVQLPLTIGEENPFVIDYKLDNDQFDYNGKILDLIFEPEQHIIIEEFTGRDCQFCPGGILTMEHLEGLYGNKIIPVALHCYNGTDPKGRNVMGYWEYTGMNAAPQGRVNRGPVSSPLYQTSTGYTNVGGEDNKLWKDYVLDELAKPTYVEVGVQQTESAFAGKLNYTVTFTSAVSMTDCNFRVFGVLVEDGLFDYQVNAYYSERDPIFGDWGYGGVHGQNTTMYVFNNVARGTWGASYNGTSGLLPNTLTAGQNYEVKISMDVPSIVENLDNCKLVAMLIDENTGRVVNAGRSDIVSAGIGDILPDNPAEAVVTLEDGSLAVSSPSACTVSVYDLSGQLVASGEGEGSFNVGLNGYTGFAIVRVASASGSSSMKIMIR